MSAESQRPLDKDTGALISRPRYPSLFQINTRALQLNYANPATQDDFTVECPTGSGRQMNLHQVAEETSRRLASIFLKDKDDRRPVYGGTGKFQDNPHWRDLVLFYEYFHGDNGAGLGASHQTGWTGIVARALHLFATTMSDQVLQLGKMAAVVEVQKFPERARACAGGSNVKMTG
jgi:hypothetical protein